MGTKICLSKNISIYIYPQYQRAKGIVRCVTVKFFKNGWLVATVLSFLSLSLHLYSLRENYVLSQLKLELGTLSMYMYMYMYYFEG